MNPPPSPGTERREGPPSIPALIRTRVRAAVRRPARLTPAEKADRALTLRLLSLLLQYPDSELTSARTELATAVGAMPATPAAERLTRFTDWFTSQPPRHSSGTTSRCSTCAARAASTSPTTCTATPAAGAWPCSP
ncbi:hypothetical protein [Streptomyces sp. I6]|uniref:hypothetical protein n=1 Tax=Streptomyces sp. I6 TaxID=2483113 RepID=UPI0011CE4BAB